MQINRQYDVEEIAMKLLDVAELIADRKLGCPNYIHTVYIEVRYTGKGSKPVQYLKNEIKILN